MKGQGAELSSAYHEYLSGEYKACLTTLQKLAKQPGDKNLNVLHNIYVLEYIMGRNPQQAATTLNKLSDLVNEIRKPPQPTQQKAGKNKQPIEQKESRHDEATLKYNMAVLTGCLGRRDAMEMILQEVYNSWPNQFAWRIGFLLLESQILVDKKLDALNVYRKLHQTKTVPRKFPQKDDKTKTKFSGLSFPDNAAQYSQVCEEQYSYLLQLFRSQLALKFGLVRTAGKLLPKRETSRVFQGFRDSVFVYKNPNLFELNLLSMGKFTQAQCEYEAKNYQKALKMLSPHSLMEVEINSPKYLNFINQLALNNIGLINYKLEKYTLSLYYISKSLESISKINATVADQRQQLIVQHFQSKQEYILVNQALLLLKLGKFKQSYEHFMKINKPSKNFKFWYRYGQAALQHFHEQLKSNDAVHESELYEEIHDNYDTCYHYPNIPYIRQHQETKRKLLSVSQKPPFYTRYVLRHNEQFIEEESLEEDRKLGPRQSTLIELKKILSNAQMAFENCYVCLTKQEIEKQVDSLDLKHLAPEIAEEIEGELEENHTKQVILFEHQNFKQNALLILAYISLCKQQWPKTIKLCQELLAMPKLTDENGYTASMYLVEAYLETEKFKEALEVSVNRWLKLGQKGLPVRCRDSLAASESHFDSMSADNVTRYNMAVLHIKAGNLSQANNVIQQMMLDMGITINSYNARIPVPVLNLQIYMHIRTENIEGALQLIKRRRILVSPGMNNNKALLKITK